MRNSFRDLVRILPTIYRVAGLPWWLRGKELARFDPWVGRSPENEWNPLQYSRLENPMNRGAWGTTVHGIAKSQTRLSEHTHLQTHMHNEEKKTLAY